MNCNSKKGIKWVIYDTVINYVTYTAFTSVRKSNCLSKIQPQCPCHDRWVTEGIAHYVK